MKRTLVEIAEEDVRIERVLQDLFSIDSVEDAGGWKTHCPLGAEHSDGGTSKAMRVYSDTNSAYCFSHRTSFTPLSLWRLKHPHMSRREAAEDMLEHYGIRSTPPTLDERWEHLEATEEKVPQDVEALRETLRYFARTTLPDYAAKQYDAEVLEVMGKIYLTSESLTGDCSYDTMVHWLQTAKNVMKKLWRKNGWY